MDDLRKGVLYSVVIHLALAGLFSSIIINSKPRLPEFVEIVLPAAASVSEPFVVAKKAKQEEISLPEAKYPHTEPKIFEPEEIAKEVPKEIAPEKYTPSAGEDFETPYTITGALSTRKVIHRKLPRYPKGYKVAVRVSVQLFVLPSGEIERMRLTKKGGVPFDELTQSVLREWKFESLPPNAPQVTQEGRITFIYKLK